MVIHRGVWSASLLLSFGLTTACVDEPDALNEDTQEVLVEELFDSMPNNVPFLNAGGFAASYSTAGYVDLSGAYFTNHGSNGRNCGSCHAPEDGWSLKGSTITLMFLATGGTHPIFVNNKDTDTPTCDMSTWESRWNCTTKLRQGMFTRSISVPANRDYEMTAFSDPFGVTTSSKLWFFRRPLPTANFRSHTIAWDSASTASTNILRDSLIRQATGNITGAQQGPTPDPAITGEIADYQIAMGHAQLWVPGAGFTNGGGAMGGPEHAANQPLVQGRFDLFDAWENSSNSKRRQIYRGQEVFNNTNVASGRRCGACHNAANNGQNVNGGLFDIGASRPEFATPGMAVFTFEQHGTGAIRVTTDPGRGIRNGQFADMDKFKTPNLRGLASRAPYYHNGIAEDLEAVVRHYENALGFVFTNKERDDLVAFMNAL